MVYARTLVVLLAVSATASAQSPQFTREFQAGVDAFRLGKLDDARAHLEKARKLDPKLPGPNRFLAAVAAAERRWQDCIDAARRAIELNPRSQELAATRKLHDTCRIGAGRDAYRDELGEQAAIAVTTNVPGATVTIGGLSYGGTPLAPRPIPAGRLELEIAKPGYTSARVTVDALAGIVTDVQVELEPEPMADVPEGVSERAATGTGALLVHGGGEITIDGGAATPTDGRFQLAPGTHVVEVRRAGKDAWRRRVRIARAQLATITPAPIDTASRERTRTVGLVLLATGGALAITGVVTRVAVDQPMVSNVSFGTAAVAVGAGALLVYLSRRESTDDPPPFAVIPVAGGALLTRTAVW